MEQFVYDRLQETLYFERLPNGLDVYVLPKKGFQKTYATFSTRYGSIDNHFRVAGKQAVKVPDGIAHFLEHKMFEQPDDTDVFAQFASHGASANAFTSFDRTTYLFSSTSHIHDNIETLLDFVQLPHFTDANVEKEKGIIAQEINMYRDNADWRVYFGLIEAMYEAHPIHIDIAGTVESIYQITKQMLYECYHTFYHPSNMMLFVVGGVDAKEVMQLVRENQGKKTFQTQGEIERIFPEEPPHVRTAKKQTVLPVSMPKCLFGFKEARPLLSPAQQLKNELSMKIMLDVLFSSSSRIYELLYDEQLITDNFGFEYNSNKDYAFSVIGGDTKDPDALVARVREEVEKVLEQGVPEEDFERCRKKKIGGWLRMLNSPEAIAGEFTKFKFRDQELFDVLPTYEHLTLQDVNSALRTHFNWDQLAVSIVDDGSA